MKEEIQKEMSSKEKKLVRRLVGKETIPTKTEIDKRIEGAFEEYTEAIADLVEYARVIS